MSRRHEISSSPENMVWGYLDSTTPPVLEIASGDTVTLHSFPAGGKESLPEDKSLVPADYLAALDTLVQGPGPHFITGPVYVKGAKPGRASGRYSQRQGPPGLGLRVHPALWLGTLPDEFTEYETSIRRSITIAMSA